MILIICVFNVNFAYAHEIYYNGSTPISLKWNYVTGSTVNMKMSDDLLEAPFTGHYSVARTAWPNALANASTRVSITDTSLSNSNIHRIHFFSKMIHYHKISHTKLHFVLLVFKS